MRGKPESVLSLIALLMALSTGSAAAQAVKGVVTDSATGKPLAGVTVTVVGTDLRSITGPDGYYRVAPVATGDHVVRAQLTGYSPVDHTVAVADTGTVTNDFVLGTIKPATPRRSSHQSGGALVRFAVLSRSPSRTER